MTNGLGLMAGIRLFGHQRFQAGHSSRTPMCNPSPLALKQVVFRHPYCKIRFLEEAGIGNRQTASKYLQELERIGLLRGVKIGREKYFINDEFFRLLVREALI